MEAIQLFQLLTWKYVTCEKNCPLDKAVEDTSPSGYRHISGKARGERNVPNRNYGYKEGYESQMRSTRWPRGGTGWRVFEGERIRSA